MYIFYLTYIFYLNVCSYTLISEGGFEIEYAKASSKRPPKLEVESITSALKILVGEQIQDIIDLEQLLKLMI
jgi:hypothetical protein